MWVQPCSFACPSVCLMMWFQCRQVHSFIFMEFYGLSTLRPSIHSLSQLHFENYWRLHKRFNLHWDDREIGFGFIDYTLELNKICDKIENLKMWKLNDMCWLKLELVQLLQDKRFVAFIWNAIHLICILRV